MFDSRVVCSILVLISSCLSNCTFRLMYQLIYTTYQREIIHDNLRIDASRTSSDSYLFDSSIIMILLLLGLVEQHSKVESGQAYPRSYSSKRRSMESCI